MSHLVIFSNDVPRLTLFYENVLDMTAVADEEGNAALGRENDEIYVHQTSFRDFEMKPREDVALKPAFKVKALASALAAVEKYGGTLTERSFEFKGVYHRDVIDPDGNIIQLRADS